MFHLYCIRVIVHVMHTVPVRHYNKHVRMQHTSNEITLKHTSYQQGSSIMVIQQANLGYTQIHMSKVFKVR